MTPSHQPLIAAEGLTRSFGSPRTGDRVEVLRGIDVTIPRGTMLAVVGPSGCGKTSLLYCLSGLDRPDGGRLRGFGADMASMPSSKLAELYRTRIGFVFQSSNLVESLTAEENVLLPDRLRGRRVDASRAASILAGLGVRERAGALPAKLSAGQRLPGSSISGPRSSSPTNRPAPWTPVPPGPCSRSSADTRGRIGAWSWSRTTSRRPAWPTSCW